MIAGWDVGGLLRNLWKDRGYPPSWLASLTPFEIMFLFAKPEPGPNPCPDPVADRVGYVHWVNHTKRGPAGQPPHVPFWMFRGEVKRRGR